MAWGGGGVVACHREWRTQASVATVTVATAITHFAPVTARLTHGQHGRAKGARSWMEDDRKVCELLGGEDRRRELDGVKGELIGRHRGRGEERGGGHGRTGLEERKQEGRGSSAIDEALGARTAHERRTERGGVEREAEGNRRGARRQEDAGGDGGEEETLERSPEAKRCEARQPVSRRREEPEPVRVVWSEGEQRGRRRGRGEERGGERMPVAVAVGRRKRQRGCGDEALRGKATDLARERGARERMAPLAAR